MFVLYHHDQAVKDPQKHFKAGNAKKKKLWLNEKAQTKSKVTFGHLLRESFLKSKYLLAL